MDEYIFKGFIVNNKEYENGNRETSGAWLTFPTDKETVKNTLAEIGLPSDAGDNMYSFYDYADGRVAVEPALPMRANIDELNYLANLLDGLDTDELMIFEDAVQAEEHTTDVDDLINLAQNTECYEIVADMYGWDDVGEYFAEEKGLGLSALEELADYIDFESFGKDYGGERGYWLGDVFLQKDMAEFKTIYNVAIDSIPSEFIVSEYAENEIKERLYAVEVEDAMSLALDIDNYMYSVDSEYLKKHLDTDERLERITDWLLDRKTLSLKETLAETGTVDGGAFIGKIRNYENEYPRDTYMLYQVKEGDGTRDYRYMPHKYLESTNRKIDKSNYELTYTAVLDKDTTLESLFADFNRDIPADYKGRSMSVSDIVVLCKDGEEKAYYCDSIGFKEVPEFLKQNRVIDTYISSTENTEKSVPLIFPASKEDITDALVKLGLPVTADSDKYYINNMLIKGNIPFFCDDNSVDEMNYLSRLISNFDEEQTKKFIAAVDYKNFESVADVINIAHNTDYYSILPDVENWRDVGKVMAERAGFSKAQIEMFGDYFNFAQYAKSLENDKGKRILQSKDMYIESGHCEWKDKYHGNFKELPRECVVSASGLSRLGEKAKEQTKKPSIRQRLKDLKKEQGGSRREQTHKPPSQEL